MAAMHLSFEEGVLEHWGAHVREAEGVRALELSFDSETKTLSLGKELAAEDTLEHDFERVVDCLSPSSASIWLVNLRQGKWILITYLSESLPPADKLVVASSVRGLITALGVSSIEAHYHASDPEELRWESFYDFLMRRTLPDGAEDNGDALRRQINRLTAEAAATASVGSGGGGGASVRFSVAPGVRDRLRAMLTELTMVEIAVCPRETLDVTLESSGPPQEALRDRFPDSAPRFFVSPATVLTDVEAAGSDHSGEVVVFLACPEDADPRSKMRAAAAAAEVRRVVSEDAGLSIKRYAEVRELQDLEALFAEVSSTEGAATPQSATGVVGDAGTTGAGSVPKFGKPKKPGRRRRAVQ